MTVVDDKNYFDLGVDVKETFDKERVGDLLLFAFVVFEAGAVVEGDVLDYHFVGNRSLGVLLVTNFDLLSDLRRTV